ncbi:AraC-type DNA-binding protein [Myroides marinus]|uniref:AraC-type DNA-binding protein n=1 Tax=Myroides marinus TaxID=703342 RepID=A0A1H6UPK3_9FLAO|nr:helix-turn-helix domain-containing protein [Myroides marinus]SEI89802.1 AraC-type DNA-binding protein [Myroides marinus]
MEVKQHTISSIVQDRGLDLKQAIYISKNAKEIEDYFAKYPHVINAFVIGLCIGGNAKIKVDLTEHTIQRGSLISLVPNSIVYPIEVSDDIEIYSLMFSFDFITTSVSLFKIELLETLRQQYVIELDDIQLELLYELYQVTSKYNYLENPIPEVQTHLFSALLLEIQGVYINANMNVKAESRYEYLTRNFFALLYKHFKSERSLQFYADQLCVTPQHLSTVIRAVTKHTLSYWMNEMVILYSKSLLKTTSLTSKEIAAELNFAEPTLFSRFFKKNTGMTPNEYRKG